MSRSGIGRAGGRLLLLAALTAPRLVRAEDPGESEARARDAYERGSSAYRAGDYARAAREFAAADALVPNAVTLRAALDAATLADDAVLGARLLSRVDRGPEDGALGAAIASARARFAHRTGRVVVHCARGVRCLAAIDGAPVKPLAPEIVSVGVHTVSVEGSGPLEQHMVEVLADQAVDVGSSPVVVAPPPPPLESPPAPGGASPAWFFAALAATGVSAGLSIWSGVDTLQRHSSFEAAGCLRGPASVTCSDLESAGTSAQTRTNALLGVTAGIGVGTAVLGLFVVRWRHAARADVGLAFQGSRLSLALDF